MISHQLLRKPPLSHIPPPVSRIPHIPRRFQSEATKTRTRATKILDLVPRSLRPYTARLRDAPLTHIVSFLILHEVTAVVPLVGLASAFHWGGWLPPLFSESSYLAPGIEKFERYFRRKGWFGLGDEEAGLAARSGTSGSNTGTEDGRAQAQAQKWNLDSPGMRIVVEVAAAYAVTKALLPLRLMLSVWATPWFARVIVGRVWGSVMGLRRAGRGTGTVVAAGGLEKSAAAGTGAMGKAAKGVGKDVPKK